MSRNHGERSAGKKTAIARFALSRAAALWRASQTAIIVAGASLLIATRVPGSSDILSTVGIDRATLAIDVILPLILIAIFLRLVELSKEIERSVPLRTVLAGPMEVYPILEQRIRQTRRGSNREIAVIGMNLKTAWPSLNLQINNGLLDGWRMSFAGFIDDGSQSQYCNPEWSQEAYRQLRSIEKASMRPDVIGRDIKLAACYYSHLPAVHGFRLKNGDLFISILRWQDGSYVSVRGYTYDFIPREDQTNGAVAMRELFDSWWDACSRKQFTKSTVKRPK